MLDGLAYERIERREDGVALTVTFDGETRTLRAERVLATTGRRPNSDGMGLEAADVALDPRGGIVVDDRLRTTRAGTYAAGTSRGATSSSTWPPTARSSPRSTP